MNSQEGINEKIERYLDQKMESRERADFEQMIKGNKEWEQKVLIIKEARLIILQESLFRFNEQIKIEEEKYLNKNKSFGKNYFLIGISILFIFSVLLFIKEEKKEQILIPEKKPLIISNNYKSAPGILIDSPPLLPRQQDLNVKKKAIIFQKNLSRVKSQQLKITIDTPHVTGVQTGIKSEKNIAAIPNKETNSTERIERTEKEIIKSDNCKGTNISAEVDLIESCSGNEGEIKVHYIKGGNPPYKFSLNNDAVVEDSIFKNLNPGTYTIIIKDHSGCSNTLRNLILKTKNCKIHYDFNPGNGEVWEVPSELGTGILSIYNKAGKIVFKKQIDTGSKEIWRGNTESGEVEPGYYLLLMHRNDGKIIQ